ncbi:DUF2796 domain-containing protein [Endozoicomonas sp. SCSIO W0465]|uniref:DUF2796 domain-containing protein n=1 Tax=Endozoicomonas sp. SCSIO W0465 TaxID=2918516 RepID=UPI002075634E|nr:DUF2796 domain-containing protein [Endozoicomonas sp. SCSIO W0465]USE33866.1 DUF2796 domain-containing protein [Endozoicomonas sp. SCSIO W0465]
MKTKIPVAIQPIMMLLQAVTRKVSWQLFTLYLLGLPAAESRAEIVLHRAVEPARIGLDISISGKSLTLYIALDEESLSVLKKKMDLELLYSQLQRMQYFAKPPVAAHCQVVGLHVNREDDQISGFQTFSCKNPGQLKYIDVKLYQALPDLKAVDVWLTTENWQYKTVVYPNQRQVAIKAGILR